MKGKCKIYIRLNYFRTKVIEVNPTKNQQKPQQHQQQPTTTTNPSNVESLVRKLSFNYQQSQLEQQNQQPNNTNCVVGTKSRRKSSFAETVTTTLATSSSWVSSTTTQQTAAPATASSVSQMKTINERRLSMCGAAAATTTTNITKPSVDSTSGSSFGSSCHEIIGNGGSGGGKVVNSGRTPVHIHHVTCSNGIDEYDRLDQGVAAQNNHHQNNHPHNSDVDYWDVPVPIASGVNNEDYIKNNSSLTKGN